MIKVYFGHRKDTVYNIDVYFDNIYEKEWFDDEFVQSMLLDVDHSKCTGCACIVNQIFGQITPEEISGGVKALIVLYKTDTVVDLVNCGENCQSWISKIASMKDIEVDMSGVDLTFKNYDISGICLNDNSTIADYKDWILKMVYFFIIIGVLYQYVNHYNQCVCKLGR